MKRRWGNEPEVENWIGGTTFISCHAVRPCSIILTAECLRWAAVRLVSAFCVQRKAFLALHHLSLHHLHLKCNSSDFFHDSYIPEDGWTGSRTDVHLCSHIYWALIWNGTARVTNLICHFLHKSETDIAFVLVVQMCRHFALSCQLPTIQRHHRLFKPIKSRRSAWYLTMRWYKTLNYSRRFHKSAFVSESLHSENQGYNPTKQCSSQWQLVVERQRKGADKGCGEIRLLAKQTWMWTMQDLQYFNRWIK